jgi:putative transposase
MSRKKLLTSDRFPYHVTARTNNKELFPIPLNEVWEILESECLTLRLLYEVEFQAIVLMPNHIHMIFTTPQANLGKVMLVFMTSFAKSVNFRSGRIGHVFGGPYFWSMITSTRYYGHALKYVYRNPVRAGLCDKVEQYPYSSLQGVLGFKHFAIPIHYTRIGAELNIPEADLHFEWLDWLNRPFTKEAEGLIRLCLSRKEMKMLIDRKGRRPNTTLDQLL